MRYEGMIYRPPSEAYSLIVQVTIGCSQNRCIFCSMFKEKRFRIRKVEEVLEDLQDARNKYRYVEKIFLADGDALICKMTDLEAILHFIKDQFPECKQVTLYGSPRSILMKQQEDLDKNQNHRLSRWFQTVDKVPVFAGTFTMSTVFLV